MKLGRFILNLVIWGAVVGIAGAAALSGLWMKPEPKEKPSPVTVILQGPNVDSRGETPKARLYPLRSYN